jgi:hypothetical protein
VPNDTQNYQIFSTSLQLTVADNVLPTISCVENQTKYIPSDQTTYTVNGTEFDPASTGDNCGVKTIANNFNHTATLDEAELPLGNNTITWTVTDEAGNSANCECMVNVIGMTTSIGNLTQNASIYPGVSKSITIDFDKDADAEGVVIVYNSLGQVIICKEINQKTSTLGSNLHAGAYLVRINNNKYNFTKMILIK